MRGAWQVSRLSVLVCWLRFPSLCMSSARRQANRPGRTDGRSPRKNSAARSSGAHAGGRDLFARVEAEIDLPPGQISGYASAIALDVHCAKRAWLSGSAGRSVSGESLAAAVTDIWEVATFYSMIQTRPVGRYHIQICKTLSCKIMGERKITEHVCNKLGIKPGETTPDGKFTVSLVECLGSCGTAPMFQLNFDYHESLTPEKIDQI